jgi:hypothetical protein
VRLDHLLSKESHRVGGVGHGLFALLLALFCALLCTVLCCALCSVLCAVLRCCVVLQRGGCGGCWFSLSLIRAARPGCRVSVCGCWPVGGCWWVAAPGVVGVVVYRWWGGVVRLGGTREQLVASEDVLVMPWWGGCPGGVLVGVRHTVGS